MPTLAQYETLLEWVRLQDQSDPPGWHTMVRRFKSYDKLDEYRGALLDEVMVNVFGFDYEVAHGMLFCDVAKWAETKVKELEDAETHN